MLPRRRSRRHLPHHQLRRVDQGIEWTLPRAKNDQMGQGKTRGLPTNPDPWVCPVAALDDWTQRLARLHNRPLQPDDPLFPGLGPTGRYDTPINRAAVGEIIQRAATRAGITGNYGSHSPRAGFITDALDAGAKREHVQTYGGWQNTKSLDPYYRRTNIWAPPTPPAASPASTTDNGSTPKHPTGHPGVAGGQVASGSSERAHETSQRRS